jgi:hypothetical protein
MYAIQIFIHIPISTPCVNFKFIILGIIPCLYSSGYYIPCDIDKESNHTPSMEQLLLTAVP